MEEKEEIYNAGILPEIEVTSPAYSKNNTKSWEEQVNEWALRNPQAIFNPKYRKQRQVLTDDTWKAIIKSNNITDPADKRFKMIPTKFQELAMQNSVREYRDDVGVKLGLTSTLGPATLSFGVQAAGAPMVQKGLQLAGQYGKQGFNWLTQQADKAFPWVQKNVLPILNKLDPFSKEFAAMGTAGKLGIGALESLGLYDAINTTEDFVSDPSIDKIPSEIISIMSALPYVSASGKTIVKYFDDIENAVKSSPEYINEYIKKIKLLPKHIQKQINAKQRIDRLQSELDLNFKYISDQIKDADVSKSNIYKQINETGREISRLVHRLENLNPEYLTEHREPELIKVPFLHNLTYKFPSPQQYYSSSLQGYNIHTPRRDFFRDSSRQHGDYNIDFSKLTEDNIWKLITKRFSDSKETDVSKMKQEFQNRGIELINKNGEWVIKSPDIEIKVSSLYDPESFITTEYNLPYYSDPTKDPLIGKIKFSGLGHKKQIYHPELSLNTGTISQPDEMSEQILTSVSLQHLDDMYINALEDNIQQVLQDIPGFVPYGSSVGVSKARFPHATDDIDGYISEEMFNQWLSSHPDIEGYWKNPDTYTAKLYPFGKQGEIDMNVIKAGQDGFITGKRAEELARVFFPEEYTKWILDKKQSSLKITVDQLLNAAKENQTAKTIADSFEINPTGVKEKHLGRPLVYLSSADPIEVQKGLMLHANSFGATDMFPATINDFNDIELNKRIIQDLGIPVSIDEVSSNPQKMKNLLDYWYLQQTIKGRGVTDNPKELIIDSMSKAWDPDKNQGGTAMGIGRNAVSFSSSGYGPYYGYFQLKSNDPINLNNSILDRINFIKKFTGDPSYNFSPKEQIQIAELGKKYGMDLNPQFITNSEYLLNVLPKTKEGADFLKALDSQLNIKGLARRGSYTGDSGNYVSITGDTDPNSIRFMMSSDVSPVHILSRKHRLNMMSTNGQEEAQDIIEALGKVHDSLKRNKHPNSSIDQLDQRLYPLNQEKFNIRFLKSKGQHQTYLDIIRKLQDERVNKQGHYNQLDEDYNKLTEYINNLESKRKINLIRQRDLELKLNKINSRESDFKSGLKAVAAGIGVATPLLYMATQASDKPTSYAVEQSKQWANRQPSGVLLSLIKNQPDHPSKHIFIQELRDRGYFDLYYDNKQQKLNYLNLFK